MRRTGVSIVAAFASAWACFAEADATSASLPDLRGFGHQWNAKAGKSSAMQTRIDLYKEAK